MDVSSEPAAPSEQELLERLRAGDEAAFVDLVERHSAGMLRLARSHVASDAVAEEVVQEAWLGVLNGLARFEGRAALKTWIYRIVANIAKTRGVKEHRSVPFATLAAREVDDEFTAVDADRFRPADADLWPHGWATPPGRWEFDPDDALAYAETLQVVRGAIDQLPPMQRMVIVMRDLEGFTSEEVCDTLDLTPANQRVLLHRARSRVRARLEEELAP